MENCNHELVAVKECTKCGKTFDTIMPTADPETKQHNIKRCPECNTPLQFGSGCWHCPACGYSKCNG